MPKVSVVIPIYNLAEYVRSCLESVTSQTLTDIEIICVDDGSTDRSRDILREYADTDDRVRVIAREHEGVSAARNGGAAVATGRYLYFLDGDDALVSDALEVLYARAEADHLDILFFGTELAFESPELEADHPDYWGYYHRNAEYPGVMSGQELLVSMSENRDWKQAVGLQFFNRETYRRMGWSFVEGVIHEDNLFSFICALQAQRVGYLDRPLHRRLLRRNSIITGEKSARHVDGLIVNYLAMSRFVEDRDFSDRDSLAVAHLIGEVLWHAFRVYRQLPEEQRRELEGASARPETHVVLSQFRRCSSELTKAVQPIGKLEQELAGVRQELEALSAERDRLAVSLDKVRADLAERTETLKRIKSSRTYRFARRLRKIFRR